MRQPLIAAFLLALSFPCSTKEADAPPLLSTVKAFYGWVLKNGESVSQIAPKITDVPDSTRFILDTSSLPAFTEKFMASQQFSSEFPDAVNRYYAKYRKEFAALTQREFDEYARDGRGPLMEVEDMDIFFCAQEYEYKPEFVDGLKIVKLTTDGDRATAVVESPYKWQTTFRFKKDKGRWLISGYCVYQ